MSKQKIILGLTGSIGMGKSTVARMFKQCGAALFDADIIVRDLLAKNRSVYVFFKESYPDVFHAGRISRKRVGNLIFSKLKDRQIIESFLHPLVRKEILLSIQKSKANVIVLEVPLLFETGFDQLCDYTLCVSASAQKQKERFLKRGRMDEQQFKSILKRQFSDQTKRNRSDYIIDTGTDLKQTRQQVQKLYKDLLNA